MSGSEKIILSSGAKLWTISEGTGAPILFFNGGPGCDDYLESVSNLIVDRCQSIRFEPRGCGRSDWDGQYGLDTLLNDADNVRKAYNHERVLLLGHSAGVNVALAYALRFPEQVAGVIGISGGKFVDDRTWSEIYRHRRESVGEDLGGKIFHADSEVNPRGNADWKEYCRRVDLFRTLADFEAPCVFINASEDIRPNWPTQQIAALIPNATYAEINGAGHSIWLTHGNELRIELNNALDYIQN